MANPPFARAPLLWLWGLARRASRNNFGATAEASATAMANPRRRTRALRYFGETIFRATAKASATASLALASVVLALGVGPTGLPETSFRAMQSGGILDADSHGKPAPSHARAPLFRRWGLARRASRNNFPGDGRSFRDSHGKPAPSHARAPLFWRWGLARRASRNNFPGDGQSFCDSLPRARFRRFGAGGWPDRASRNKFPSDAKRGDLGRRQPWQTRAVARARSVISALGAGPSGFPKQSSGRSFRDSHGKPAPSLAHAPLFWRWGLARRASRNKFPSDAKRGDLGGRRGICGPKPMSQHGRPRFSRARARPVAAMAVLSTRSGQMARSLASGCGWPISYCPVEGVYQRPG